jgi:MoaA/NifB/PqqE/SkfB family radical SAM enzyme
MTKLLFRETATNKIVMSPNYNFVFYKTNGNFARWGKTKEDDPQQAPAPEIADIEISTVCTKGCPFCYKGNTACGKNMTLEQFKDIFAKLPRTLTQIAFGIGDVSGNPDLEAILAYTRSKGVVPNITINAHNMTAEQYDMLARHCGAVAVSLYNYDDCYNAVEELSKRGMKQVNIHCLLSHETFDRCLAVITNAIHDTRLKGKLNAIVFLHLKSKGRAVSGGFTNPTDYEFKSVVDYALSSGVGFGFDSCSANKAMRYLPKEYHERVEPCESTLFSCYINVEGYAYPCSFAEDVYDGVLVTAHEDFWNSIPYKQFREKCLACKRSCPIYDLGE